VWLTLVFGGDGRRGGAGATQDDDGGSHHGRVAAHSVEHRNGFGSHAPHRRADGRRHDLIDGADAGGDPGDLRAGQTVAVGAGAGGVSFVH